MVLKAGTDPGPLLILHGGAGPMDPSDSGIADAERSLVSIGREGARLLTTGCSPVDVIEACLHHLENDPQFNAGIGSALQADGVPRLSAAIMDGHRQRFSGIINAQYVPYPSRLARALQNNRARTLSSPGIELLARELSVPVMSSLSRERTQRWLGRLKEKSYEPLGNPPAVKPGTDRAALARGESQDTVGVVLRTAEGQLIVGASTGGRGFEYPGRVSDTGSVAGTYASGGRDHCRHWLR